MAPWETEAREQVARLDREASGWRSFGILRTALWLVFALREVDHLRSQLDRVRRALDLAPNATPTDIADECEAQHPRPDPDGDSLAYLRRDP